MPLDHPALAKAPYARRLARSALDCAGRVPVAAADKAKTCLFDFIGCAFEARDLPWSRQAQAIARPDRDGAPIIGTRLVAHPSDAAFANAVAGHGLVREDMHAGSVSHHGVVVWPTMLALGGQTDVDVERFLTSGIVGYEAGARIGRALFDGDLSRLFRPTGTAGLIGATVAGGYLVGLDEDQLTSALALAANMAGGLNQWPYSGGDDMYFHPGAAARSALLAVGLAQAGSRACEDIFEGTAGLFAAFKRAAFQEPAPLFADGTAEILAVYNKPAPACNFAQTACQAALHLAAGLGADRARIAAVTIRVPQAAARYPGCDCSGPFARSLQAKMSIQYGVAAALARGALEEANYQRLDRPDVLRLLNVTSLEVDDDLTAAFPGKQGAEVTVALSDGRRVSRRMDDVVPASADDVRRRFRGAARAVVGAERAGALESAVEALSATTAVRSLAALCLAPGAARPAPGAVLAEPVAGARP